MNEILNNRQKVLFIILLQKIKCKFKKELDILSELKYTMNRGERGQNNERKSSCADYRKYIRKF